ncbi:MAG: T9SS type A sorting domain-containing protein, partial [Ekhidna sp.]
GIAGMQLTNDITKIAAQTKVRARIKYDPVTSLNGQVFGPWIYPQGYFESQGMSAAPLPIELVFFNVSNDGTEVIIEWQTASETNNDYFVIERSVDASSWKKIMQVKGAGNSSDVLTYQKVDSAPHQGISYYRLIQIDHDGQFTYSNIERLDTRNTLNKHLSIYPNPVTTKAVIIGMDEASKVTIFNMNGHSMIDQIDIQYREESADIDVTRLPNGIYFLKTENQTIKLIKK